jgi:hypothetical protein
MLTISEAIEQHQRRRRIEALLARVAAKPSLRYARRATWRDRLAKLLRLR